MDSKKIDIDYFVDNGFLKKSDDETYFNTQKWSYFINKCFKRNTIITDDKILIKIVTPEDLEYMLTKIIHKKGMKKFIDDSNNRQSNRKTTTA